MATRVSYFDLINRVEGLRARLADLQVAESPDPSTQDAVARELADLQLVLTNALQQQPAPHDRGLAGLIGIGDEATDTIDNVYVNVGVVPYDEVVTSERLLAMSDLYYIYQHERAGVFRAVLKLQELFKAGRIRLSDGPGAVALFQYDRLRVLRTAQPERMQAYRRAFGYTNAQPPAGARPNVPFHRLFTAFNTEVAQYFRDRRISEVVRPDGRDLTFGSVAVVRRAGLDLRANLKHASYGHVVVLAAEVSQLLEKAFAILNADDVRRVFGADNAWDTLEEVLERYLGERIEASQRSRMGYSGREVIRWLAQPHILTNGRQEFEGLLISIGEYCEEWLTSADSLGAGETVTRPQGVLPFRRVGTLSA
jgi:hypothetical protein